MGIIYIEIDRSLSHEIEGKRDDLEPRFNELFEQLKELYSIQVAIYTPFWKGGLVAGLFFEDIGVFGFFMDNTEVYYPFVILGTDPHIIEGNPWLYWEGADHPVRRVQHPGTAANDFMATAYDASEGDVNSELSQFLDWVVE